MTVVLAGPTSFLKETVFARVVQRIVVGHQIPGTIVTVKDMTVAIAIQVALTVPKVVDAEIVVDEIAVVDEVAVSTLKFVITEIV